MTYAKSLGDSIVRYGLTILSAMVYDTKEVLLLYVTFQ